MGTRPEAIKMAPVVAELRAHHAFEPVVVATGQHRQMLDQVLEIFEIVPEFDLNLMTAGQTLTGLTARLLMSLERIWTEARPDLVLVQGDTTSTFVAGLVAYYLKIPVGHVEAGLRTQDKYAPFPEEMNRRLTDVLTDYFFAPTTLAREHLIREGVPDSRIWVTGNTGIDALLYTIQRNRETSFQPVGLPAALSEYRQLILVTAHRRESFGPGMKNICEALRVIAERCPHAAILYPVHLNPNVQEPVSQLLQGIPNVFLTRPLDYRSFAHVMARSDLILTDSGGIQEEAPTFGIPVLVMREVTERVEAITGGTAEMVGTSTRLIVERTLALLSSPRPSSPPPNPFGDGNAAQRIVAALDTECADPADSLAGALAF